MAPRFGFRWSFPLDPGPILYLNETMSPLNTSTSSPGKPDCILENIAQKRVLSSNSI